VRSGCMGRRYCEVGTRGIEIGYGSAGEHVVADRTIVNLCATLQFSTQGYVDMKVSYLRDKDSRVGIVICSWKLDGRGWERATGASGDCDLGTAGVELRPTLLVGEVKGDELWIHQYVNRLKTGVNVIEIDTSCRTI
jgi:hypothetical protein